MAGAMAYGDHPGLFIGRFRYIPPAKWHVEYNDFNSKFRPSVTLINSSSYLSLILIEVWKGHKGLELGDECSESPFAVLWAYT